jgi:hypothetical protein
VLILNILRGAASEFGGDGCLSVEEELVELPAAGDSVEISISWSFGIRSLN